MSEMLQQVKQAKEDAKSAARTGGQVDESEELPEGSSPLEAREASSEDEGETPEETPETPEGDASVAASAASDEEEGEIRIGTKTFKSQREAFDYAAELERTNELTEAHSAGIREALEATRQPAQQNPEPEDDFDEKFYSNPKEALRAAEERAVTRALAITKQEATKEKMWEQFLTEYPDVRRKDAERIIVEKWDVIGKITDVSKAMKVLATNVRNEYDEIETLRKPKTVLADRKQVVSSSGGAPKGVTPQKKPDAPLDFISQLKTLKGHK